MGWDLSRRGDGERTDRSHPAPLSSRQHPRQQLPDARAHGAASRAAYGHRGVGIVELGINPSNALAAAVMAEISTHTHIHTGRFRAMSRYRVPRENSSQRHTEGRFSAAPDNFVQCRDFGDLRGLGASSQASSLARCRTACGCTINHSERIERGQNCTPIGGHFSTPIDIIDPAWHQEVCNFQPPYLCNFRPPLTGDSKRL